MIVTFPLWINTHQHNGYFEMDTSEKMTAFHKNLTETVEYTLLRVLTHIQSDKEDFFGRKNIWTICTLNLI